MASLGPSGVLVDVPRWIQKFSYFLGLQQFDFPGSLAFSF